MAKLNKLARQRELEVLKKRNHTLNGAVLFGLTGYVIELQARVLEIYSKPQR